MFEFVWQAIISCFQQAICDPNCSQLITPEMDWTLVGVLKVLWISMCISVGLSAALALIKLVMGRRNIVTQLPRIATDLLQPPPCQPIVVDGDINVFLEPIFTHLMHNRLKKPN